MSSTTASQRTGQALLGDEVVCGDPRSILSGALGRLDFWTFVAICAMPAMFAQFVVFFFVWLLISARVSGGSGVAKRIRSARKATTPLVV